MPRARTFIYIEPLAATDLNTFRSGFTSFVLVRVCFDGFGRTTGRRHLQNDGEVVGAGTTKDNRNKLRYLARKNFCGKPYEPSRNNKKDHIRT